MAGSADDRVEERGFDWNGRVYLLGAGASAFAGYPLAAGLLTFIRGFKTREVRAREIASALLEKLGDAEFHFSKRVIRDPNGQANLEELLTYLELYRSFPGTQFNQNPWTSSDSNAVRRAIADRFLAYQYDLSTLVWRSGNPVEQLSVNAELLRKVAEAWGDRVQPGDVVVTFNWDILHEVILWHAVKWSYRDGYSFQFDDQGQNERRSQVLLLKLHGSVNWVQNDIWDPVSEIANVPDFFAGARDWEWRPHHHQAQADSGRKLILPTYLKDVSSNSVLLGLWTQAHQLISKATELVVVGYSLHPVDHPVRLLVGTALSENRSMGRVTVISPDVPHWGSFLPTVNKQLQHVPKTFEKWLTG